MIITNGRIIIGEPNSISFPDFGNHVIGFKEDGVEIIMNTLTLIRLFSMLDFELTKNESSVEDYYEKLRQLHKSEV
jgi:hypothetical protein